MVGGVRASIYSLKYFSRCCLRKKGAPYPVVSFSPGNGTNIEFYSGIVGEMVSQGYIVVGLIHPHDVAAVELSSGSVAPYDKDQWLLSQREHATYTAERIKVRTADVLSALDQPTALNSSVTSPLAGLFDLDSVAVVGHSIGGFIASEAHRQEDVSVKVFPSR
jgi:predicted dienelactone hydrolase